MKKVFKNNDEVIHIFAQRTHEQGRNSTNSVYFRGDKIYSYGSHYLLGEFINDSTIIINDSGYSVSTSKHISTLLSATTQYKQFYTSSIDIKAVESGIKFDLKKLAAARKPEIYIGNITRALSGLQKWEAYCTENKIVHSLSLKNTDKTLKKLIKIGFSLLDENFIEKIKAIEIKERKSKAAKEKRELKKNLVLFNTFETDYIRNTKIDYLRLSQDKTQVETSQGIRIDIQDAKRLFICIKNKIDIRGYKIGYYTVTSINGTLIVGCHNIEMNSVNLVGKQILKLSENV